MGHVDGTRASFSSGGSLSAWEDTWVGYVDGITLCLGGHVGGTRGWDTFLEIYVTGTLALVLGHSEVLYRKEGL